MSLINPFFTRWHPGKRVQEVNRPFRKGTIRATIGTTIIVVGLDGRPPANFYPSQLTLL